ncbi:RNA polymerase sigma factor [Solibaculum mannosilyticum]|uniref:RNA polymerase sigma factor n=1 Tax=Solibaculum mannosilyticum TaxID=2780922 RepID=UPI0007A845D9|nr:RNA polymerase factor sigma-70 [Eubacteriaceae bacterium CHKCI005]
MKSVQPLNPSDTDFMGKLFEKYFSLMKKAVLSVNQDSTETEDLVVEAFIRVTNKINLLKTLDEPALAAYLRITARNVAIKDVKRKNRFSFLSVEKLYEQVEESPEEEIESDEGVCNLLSGLSQIDKEITFLRYYLDYDIKTIAKETGLRRGYISERLYQIRGKFRKKLQKEGEQ